MTEKERKILEDANVLLRPMPELTAIVRCKDCKYHEKSICHNPWVTLPDCVEPIKTADWFFCADGERREDG